MALRARRSPFREDGGGKRLSPFSIEKYEEGYGRWLGFLDYENDLAPKSPHASVRRRIASTVISCACRGARTPTTPSSDGSRNCGERSNSWSQVRISPSSPVLAEFLSGDAWPWYAAL
jgi:hypothetical protein